VEAIEFASKKTGVRKEFLMAMLDKESDLGRFTGGCTYKNTRVKESDKEAFKEICDELDYDYKKQKISCALSYGYGGAMGVAQFMPTTWMGYKDAISNYTGHKPPDPWNLTDGVVGMAEKLRRAGGDSKKGEHYAAKVYYCGGPGSSYWNTHCEAYANTVISWSSGYDDYF
jgi:membrane-bound lytic murein transglycosylase B